MKKLRVLEHRDVPFYNCVRNECSKFLHDPSTYTLPEAYDWFKSNTSPFFIYEYNNEMVGYFRTSNWTTDSCYVGMDIHKDYRGKKLAYDAYIMLFSFLRNHHNLKCFYLEVLSNNIRALNLYKKLGFISINKKKNNIKMQLK